jgi:hypothetical protein
MYRSFRRGLILQLEDRDDDKTHVRLYRNPNLVDLPDWTSNSKGGRPVPVSASLNKLSLDAGTTTSSLVGYCSVLYSNEILSLVSMCMACA